MLLEKGSDWMTEYECTEKGTAVIYFKIISIILILDFRKSNYSLWVSYHLPVFETGTSKIYTSL
jgi:hypothetical protein